MLWIPHRLLGDTNFDGKVDFSDLLIVAQHYGQTGEWVDGNFIGGNTVGFEDLLALAQHYGQSQSASQLYSAVSLSGAGSGQVPEPSSLGVVALSLFSLRRRRK